MSTAILFGVSNSLGFTEIRAGLARIPEVALRLNEAQLAWDSSGASTFSFHQYLVGDGAGHLHDVQLQNLISVSVQLGLYDRYIRTQNKPKYLISADNLSEVMKIISGEKTLTDVVKGSQAVEIQRPMAPLTIADLHVMPEAPVFSVYRVRTDVEITASGQPSRVEKVANLTSGSITQIIEKTHEELKVNKVVYVGPGLFSNRDRIELGLSDIQVLESIDIDPMLAWFWDSVKAIEIPA